MPSAVVVSQLCALGVCALLGSCVPGPLPPESPTAAPDQRTAPTPTPLQASTREPASGLAAAPNPAQAIVFKNIGLEKPECVVHDTASDTYLVSNIWGKPAEADGQAFISKLNPDGTVVALKFIDSTQAGTDLNAPKGMAIAGDTLYVTDIHYVRSFELATGKAKASVHFPEATFLNDIALGPEGELYVSDSGLVMGKKGLEPTGSNALYRLNGKKLSRVAQGPQLNSPNGVIVDGESVLLVTRSGSSLSRYSRAAIQRMAEEAKPKLLEPDARIELPKGYLDGIVRIAEGQFLISSWDAKGLFLGKLDAELRGTFEQVISDLDSPADLGFDQKRKRVLVPLLSRNEVHAIPFVHAVATSLGPQASFRPLPTSLPVASGRSEVEVYRQGGPSSREASYYGHPQ